MWVLALLAFFTFVIAGTKYDSGYFHNIWTWHWYYLLALCLFPGLISNVFIYVRAVFTPNDPPKPVPAPVPVYTPPVVITPPPPGLEIITPEERLHGGCWVVARPGLGKTTLLNALIARDLPEVAKGKASILMMDSKSHKTEALVDPWRNVDFEKLHPGLKGKVHIFDPENVSINVMELGDTVQTIDLLEYMINDMLGFKGTEYQQNLLAKCVFAVKAMPKPSLPLLQDLLRRGSKPYLKYIQTLEETDRNFFLLPGRDEKTTPFDSKLYRDRAEEVLGRLDRLQSLVYALRPMFNCTETRVDLRKLIDDGNILIVPAKTATLGDRGCEFWSRLWTMMLRRVADHRRSTIPCYFYCDEADQGLGKDTKLSSLLDRCRSARIVCTISHQRTGQIEDKIRAALEQCHLKLTSTQKTWFSVSIGDGYPTTIKVPDVQPSLMPQLTAREAVSLTERMKALYGVKAPQEPEPPRPRPTEPRVVITPEPANDTKSDPSANAPY